MIILVVDDEEIMRHAISGPLMKDGHTILLASSGTEALKVIAFHPEIEAVLTDLKMPGMDGLELLAEINANHPRIHKRALMSSLFTEREQLRRLAEELGAAFLLKPFESKVIKAFFQDPA